MQEGQTPMPRPPLAVRVLDPIVRRLLGMGVPMGPNTLLTVRGRKSGEPRSAGVAVVEIGNRRWIVGAYGDVHWVRNLRAAGEGEILDRGRQRRFSAEEYGTARAARWFRDVRTSHPRDASPKEARLGDLRPRDHRRPRKRRSRSPGVRVAPGGLT